MFDCPVPAFDIAAFFQTLVKARQLARASHRRDRVQYSDHRHRWLLRLRRKRPRCRAAQRVYMGRWRAKLTQVGQTGFATQEPIAGL
jgi:hypothetical protein